jgi:tetrahydromethanopterin S-methyltransferase subunit G
MNIQESIEILTSYQLETNKKAEKKLCNCFVRILSSLSNKDLTEDQIQSVEEKLTSLNLKVDSNDRFQHIKKSLTEFSRFLKEKFSFTPEKYYTEMGMALGMCFGSGIGLSIGLAINPRMGTSFGLSIGVGVGMVLGMVVGAQKDAKAKEKGLVV